MWNRKTVTEIGQDVGRVWNMKNIENDHSFTWCTNSAPKKINFIVLKSEKKYKKRKNGYGIDIPKPFRKYKETEIYSHNTIWVNVVRLEMKSLQITFTNNNKDIKYFIGF